MGDDTKKNEVLTESEQIELIKQAKRIKAQKGLQEMFEHLKSIAEYTDPKNIKTTKPSDFIQARSKLAGELDSLEQTEKVLGGFMGIEDYKNKLTTGNKEGYKSTTYVDIDNMATTKNITMYDKEVLNAVSTIYHYGNTFFTPAMVFRTMNGQDSTTKVTPAAAGAVTKSINKLSITRIKIDCTEQYNTSFKDDKQDKVILGNYLIPVNFMEATLNGKITMAYKFIDTPPVYSYSKKFKQISHIPNEVKNLNASNNKSRKHTTTNISIRSYLMERIEAQKGGYDSNVIYYDRRDNEIIKNKTIYEILENEDPSQEEKNRIRKNTTEILDHFKEKEYITDYKENRRGKKYISITFEVKKEVRKR